MLAASKQLHASDLLKWSCTASSGYESQRLSYLLLTTLPVDGCELSLATTTLSKLIRSKSIPLRIQEVHEPSVAPLFLLLQACLSAELSDFFLGLSLCQQRR